ncbi:MAG: hypothetical protein JXC36_09130 [Candidatus Atribacteria bacterium]|nr:hypothetical protein [Candidatus Atribacteria bacterium]
MSEFVVISKNDFETFLKHYDRELKLVQDIISYEYIYDIPTEKDNIVIRIYSSISCITGRSRSKGRDAIRCVLFDIERNLPLGKTSRTHRISNWEDNLKNKIEYLQNKVK